MENRFSRWAVALSLAVIGSSSLGQDPWPLERQDRYGTARAVLGPDPATLTTPWISNRLTTGVPVSHGASIRADGTGFFGNWVQNRVLKFSTSNGALLGAFQSQDFIACVPAIGPNNMLVASSDSPNAKLFGIDIGIMDFQWFRQTGYVGGSPNIGPEGDTVFSTSGGFVYRLNVVTGAEVWSRSGFGVSNGTVVFTRDDSKVIVSNGSSITALNWSNGTTAWSINYGSTMGRPGVAPNGTIVVGSASGTIYGLNPNSGAILWTWVALDKAQGAPAFSPDGTVAYVPSVDFRVYALRVSDGARLWSFTTSMWCEHGPVVDTFGRIYVHNKNWDLYCIAPNGAQVWKVRMNGESRGPMTIGPDGTLYVGYSGGTGGLAIIRQHGLSLNPDQFFMERGVILSGGLAQLMASDNDSAVMGKSFVANATERPIRAVVMGQVPVGPASEISIKVESRANTQGLTKWIDIWNHNLNSWDPVAIALETTTDSLMTGIVSNANAYTDQNGFFRVRVSWKETGIVHLAKWETALDYVHFDVVPAFVP